MPESFIPVWMSIGEAEEFRRFLQEEARSTEGEFPEKEFELIDTSLRDERPRSVAEMMAEQASAETSPKEGREYRVNAHDGIYGPFPDRQAALLELGEHQADWDENGGSRPPELESRAVGPWLEGAGLTPASTFTSDEAASEGSGVASEPTFGEALDHCVRQGFSTEGSGAAEDNCWDCGHRIGLHSGQGGTGCLDCSCRRTFNVYTAEEANRFIAPGTSGDDKEDSE